MDEPMEDSGTESQGKTEETGVKSRQMPLTMGSSMGMKLVTPNHEPGPGLRLKDTNPINIGLPFTDRWYQEKQPARVYTPEVILLYFFLLKLNEFLIS